MEVALDDPHKILVSRHNLGSEPAISSFLDQFAVFKLEAFVSIVHVYIRFSLVSPEHVLSIISSKKNDPLVFWLASNIYDSSRAVSFTKMRSLDREQSWRAKISEVEDISAGFTDEGDVKNISACATGSDGFRKDDSVSFVVFDVVNQDGARCSISDVYECVSFFGVIDNEVLKTAVACDETREIDDLKTKISINILTETTIKGYTKFIFCLV